MASAEYEQERNHSASSIDEKVDVEKGNNVDLGECGGGDEEDAMAMTDFSFLYLQPR